MLEVISTSVMRLAFCIEHGIDPICNVGCGKTEEMGQVRCSLVGGIVAALLGHVVLLSVGFHKPKLSQQLNL